MDLNINKKVVIMQPTFLPWLGYFDLIDYADIFVFLDNVQFEKQTWQQRNRIRTNKGLEWITTPVLIKGRFGQEIKDVKINQTVSPSKIIKQLQHNYSRSAYFKDFFDEFVLIFEHAYAIGNLCDLNIEIIKWLCTKLSLSANFVRSSQLKVSGKRSELLVDILKKIGSKHYISPTGSLAYLNEEYRFFEERSVSVFYKDYDHPEYTQAYKPFTANASCIDLLFNEGPKGLDIIRSGRGELIEAKKEILL
ncbi:MAG: WbqC family protein [Candidatus Zapsychrus exili]|nr:WbqC family protein [Candidatus Zapsychrus exili]